VYLKMPRRPGKKKVVMGGSVLSKSKRMIATIIGLVMLVVVLFSVFHIALEKDHHCTGKDCPICAYIRQCENTLRQILGGTCAQIAIAAPAIALLFAFLYVVALSPETPVSKKVRLND
jgi:hypothetical protein